MHGLLLVALLVGALQTPPSAATSAAAADQPDVNGVWEGRRSRARLGACIGAGPGRTTLTLWTEPDGTVRGRFPKSSGSDTDLKGKLEGRKVVFEAPRVATCNGDTRRYSVTLEGSFAADTDGKRRLTLTGVDQTCPSMSCSFRDEYTLTWMRPAPAPAAR